MSEEERAGEVARGLSQDLRYLLLHAWRRHLGVSRVPLNAEQVATLFEHEMICIDPKSRHENDWFFSDLGREVVRFAFPALASLSDPRP